MGDLFSDHPVIAPVSPKGVFMDKKKPSKSPGKKKSSVKKKAAPKKSTKGAAKKDLRPKPTPAKKAAAAKPKAKAKKAAAPKKAKLSAKDLLFKKFDSGVLKTAAAKSPVETKAPADVAEAPPFVTGDDDKETQRIRTLLFQQFDLTAPPPVKEAEKAKPAEEPAEPMPEVFERPRYEAPDWVLTEKPRPMGKAITFGLCGLVLLVVIMVGASFSNRGKFHLKNAEAGVQVLRGKFAPTGTELVMSLNGMRISDPIREAYSEKDAYLVISNYFLKKADEALDAPGGPDFAKISRHLRQAILYASTKESRNLAQLRLNSMNFLSLLHKADVALTKGKLPDLRTAKAYLEEADSYAVMDYQSELIRTRQATLDKMIAALEGQ
jgi:hypothetical protein